MASSLPTDQLNPNLSFPKPPGTKLDLVIQRELITPMEILVGMTFLKVSRTIGPFFLSAADILRCSTPLKERGVSHVYPLEQSRPGAASDGCRLVYLCRPSPPIFRLIARAFGLSSIRLCLSSSPPFPLSPSCPPEHIAGVTQLQGSAASDRLPVILCVPQRDIACEEILEEEGVHGLIELR